MAQARGINSAVTLFEEDTYGQDPGTPDGYKVPFTSFSLAKNQNRIDSNVIAGSRARVEPFLGNVDVSGTLGMEVGAENIGTLMKHLLGTNNTTGVDPYTHTITIGDLPIGLTMEVDYGSEISGSGRYVKYNGCRIGSANFNFPQEGAVTAQFNMVGADAALASTPLDATITDNGHTTFTGFEASLQEGGAGIATVTSVDLTVDNGLDTSQYVIGGAGVRSSLPDGFVTVSGTLTAQFDSAALMTKALNNTETSLEITVSRGDGLGSAGNEEIVFSLNQMKYEPTTPGVDGPNGIIITLPFKSYLKAADNGLEVVIKNAVATI